MLDIMKAIYDMMGKCTYPVLKEETPRQHVEVFFQAGVTEPPPPPSGEAPEQRLYLSCVLSPTEDGQEQRRRGDHRRVHRLLPKRKTNVPESGRRRRLGLAVTLSSLFGRTKTS